MFRKILTVLIIVAGAAGLWYAYDYYQRARTPVREAMDCIPGDALFILESRRSVSTLEKLLTANQMWEELRHIGAMDTLSSLLYHIDSCAGPRLTEEEWLTDRPFYLSLHLRAEGTAALLFAWALPELSDEPALEELLGSYGTALKEETEGFGGAVIRAIRFNNDKRDFFFSIHEGVFLASYSRALVNEAILHSETGLPLKDDNAFSRVFGSAGERNDANLYLRLAGLNKYLRLIRNETASDITFPEELGNWSALDLTMHTNQLVMNGYTGASPSGFLSGFRQQEPQTLDILNGIPASAAYAVTIGIGDLMTYADDRERVRLLEENDSQGTQSGPTLSNYPPDLRSSFLSWTNNQAAAFTDEQGDSPPDLCLVFFAPDPLAAGKVLEQLCGKADSVKKITRVSRDYNGIQIRRLHGSAPYEHLLGKPFRDLKEPWYMILNNYVYFSEDAEQLVRVTESVRFRNSLGTDPKLNGIMNEYFSEECNFFLYARLPSLSENIVSDLTPSLFRTLEPHLAVLNKFDLFALQFTNEKELYYTNALLHYTASSKQEIATVWEAETEYEVHMKPWLLMNHTNGTKDVLIQDDSATISLWSNTGKLLWKKKLDGMIRGNVQQIDIYGNDKLQLVFNTDHRLHLLDRNGKYLDGFPVNLPSPATAPLAVFDYEKNHDYRLVLPLADRKIMNYTIRGIPADKWKPLLPDKQISLPLRHLRSGGKDHLFAVDEGGKVYWMNRRGEWYQKLKVSAIPNPVQWMITEGKQAGRTYLTIADSSGNITQIYTGGKKESIHPLPPGPGRNITLGDVDLDGVPDLLIAADSSLFCFAGGKKLLFRVNAGARITQAPILFRLSGNRIRIGVVCGEKEELLLCDEQGNLNKTVFKGSGMFSVGELNKDGVYYLLAPAGRKRVMAWPLGK
ncbi:MAG: hypothetical protein IT233_01175 [Bacteroidia bacterium]|nr:hypothetical protein [Bacteroidia bacterium]